jgi:hypothetical protein
VSTTRSRRIDPDTAEVTATVPVDPVPTMILARGPDIWVTHGGGTRVWRLRVVD